MSGISEAYSNAELWQSRREILSIVAPKISLKLMQLYVPGLTSGRFSAARLHAKKYGVGSRVDTATKVVQRFDDQKLLTLLILLFHLTCVQIYPLVKEC